MSISFALSDGLDADHLAERFAADGRVQVRNFLAGDAAGQLQAMLRARTDWLQIFNSGPDRLV